MTTVESLPEQESTAVGTPDRAPASETLPALDEASESSSNFKGPTEGSRKTRLFSRWRELGDDQRSAIFTSLVYGIAIGVPAGVTINIYVGLYGGLASFFVNLIVKLKDCSLSRANERADTAQQEFAAARKTIDAQDQLLETQRQYITNLTVHRDKLLDSLASSNDLLRRVLSGEAPDIRIGGER